MGFYFSVVEHRFYNVAQKALPQLVGEGTDPFVVPN